MDEQTPADKSEHELSSDSKKLASHVNFITEDGELSIEQASPSDVDLGAPHAVDVAAASAPSLDALSSLEMEGGRSSIEVGSQDSDLSTTGTINPLAFSTTGTPDSSNLAQGVELGDDARLRLLRDDLTADPKPDMTAASYISEELSLNNPGDEVAELGESEHSENRLSTLPIQASLLNTRDPAPTESTGRETLALVPEVAEKWTRNQAQVSGASHDALATGNSNADLASLAQSVASEAPDIHNSPGLEVGAAAIAATPATSMSATTSSMSPAAPALIVAMPQDIPAIVSEALGSEGEGRDRITIQLDPPELGRVSIDFKFDPQGLQTVTVTGETPEALRRLRAMHVDLVQALQDNGLSDNSLAFGDDSRRPHRDQNIIFTQRKDYFPDAEDADGGTPSVSGRHPLRVASKDGLDLKL